MTVSDHTKEDKPLEVLHQDLAGKNAVVSGASRGIGRAIALHLALRGANILGTCSSPKSLHHITSLADTVQAAYSHGSSHHQSIPRIAGLDANLLSEDTPTRLADAVAEHFDGGKLDILVNNAAYDKFQPLGQLDAAYVARSLQGNVQTLVLSVDELFKRGYFRPNSRIVNISSTLTRGPGPQSPSFFALFGATKAAMECLTRSWADAFGKHPGMEGTTVNALAVGATATDAFNGANGDNAELTKHLVSQQSVGDRLGTAEDVADVVGLLVSERAGWITGSVVSANGGASKIL